MWQKAHPIGLRVWIIKSRGSEWIAKNKKQSQVFFVEDINIRKFINKYYDRSGITKLVIRKTEKEWELIIFSAKVWLIMWKNWEKIKVIEEALKKKFNKTFKVTVKGIKVPELSARFMAEMICTQIEWRMPFRRVAKSIIQKVMLKWAEWVKVQMKWRLWWVDIARMEKFNDWRVPLQTLRHDIDYHYTTAATKYWVVGVKVWIAKGDVYNTIWSEKK